MMLYRTLLEVSFGSFEPTSTPFSSLSRSTRPPYLHKHNSSLKPLCANKKSQPHHDWKQLAKKLGPHTNQTEKQNTKRNYTCESLCCLWRISPKLWKSRLDSTFVLDNYQQQTKFQRKTIIMLLGDNWNYFVWRIKVWRQKLVSNPKTPTWSGNLLIRLENIHRISFWSQKRKKFWKQLFVHPQVKWMRKLSFH